MGLDISQFSPSFEFSLPRSRIILRAEKGKAECGGGDVFQAATGGHLDLQSFLLFAANAQPTLRHNCFFCGAFREAVLLCPPFISYSSRLTGRIL